MCRCSIFASFHWAFVSKLHIYRTVPYMKIYPDTQLRIVTWLRSCCFFFALLSFVSRVAVRYFVVVVASVVRSFVCSYAFLCHISLFTQIAFIESYVTEPISTANTEAQHNHPLDRHTPYLVHIPILLIDTDTDTRERFYSVFFPLSQYRIPKSNKKPSFLLRINVLMFMFFRCVCLFSHVNWMPIH